MVFSVVSVACNYSGFTGNILLKSAEGVIKYMMGALKGVFYKVI